jgi:hypothetical protein
MWSPALYMYELQLLFHPDHRAVFLGTHGISGHLVLYMLVYGRWDLMVATDLTFFVMKGRGSQLWIGIRGVGGTRLERTPRQRRS